MNAPAWYDDWRFEAVSQLADKQDRLQHSYGLGSFPSWEYNLETATLTFFEDVAKLVGDIQVIGTTSAKNWLWGWGNAHFPEPVTEDARRLKAFGYDEGIEQLTVRFLKDDDLEALGWEMAAIAVRVADAIGAYKAPTKSGALFILIRNMRRVN